MIEPTEPTTTQSPSPARFRFTLRTMFIMTATVGGVLALFIPYAGCLGLFFALLVVAAGWSYLSLRDSPITDVGLPQLARLTMLAHLNVTGTKITEEGVKKLVDALSDCVVISEYGPKRR